MTLKVKSSSFQVWFKPVEYSINLGHSVSREQPRITEHLKKDYDMNKRNSDETENVLLQLSYMAEGI